MRVLITNHFPLSGSGSGAYAANVGRTLVEAGHEVMAVVVGGAPDDGRPFPVRTITLPFKFPCFTTHPASENTFAALSEAEARAYEAAWEAAVNGAVRDFRPDVIHGQHLWTATAAAVRTGVPVVATSHGTDLMGWRSVARFRGSAEEAARGARRVVAVSRHNAVEVARDLGVGRDRLRVVYNGYDAGTFRPGAPPPREVLDSWQIALEAAHLVVYVGKLARFKGVDVLLEAASIYEGRIPGVLTVVCGDGGERPALLELAGRLGLARVVFLGHTTSRRVADLFGAADCVVVPSRDEPFGMVALEAMACGTPVVASAAGGLAEFVHEGVGSLVPPEDPAALAEAVVQGCAPGVKARKGPAAADYALRFAWPLRVRELIGVYVEALAAVVLLLAMVAGCNSGPGVRVAGPAEGTIWWRSVAGGRDTLFVITTDSRNPVVVAEAERLDSRRSFRGVNTAGRTVARVLAPAQFGRIMAAIDAAGWPSLPSGTGPAVGEPPAGEAMISVANVKTVRRAALATERDCLYYNQVQRTLVSALAGGTHYDLKGEGE